MGRPFSGRPPNPAPALCHCHGALVDIGRHGRPVGLHGPVGGARAAAAGASDETSRSVRGACALRAAITPAGRGAGIHRRTTVPERPTSKHIRMNGACRLKRVFEIEIEQCARCGGRLQVLASIEEPELIERTLAHRRERGEEGAPTGSLGARAPPQASLF